MGRGKMDEAAAARIRKARGEKVGRPRWQAPRMSGLSNHSIAGRFREAGRDGCKIKQGQLGAERAGRRTGRKRQWRAGRGRG